MFDSTRPPLLVLPVSTSHVSLFPSHEGYLSHQISDSEALVSYRDGWTIPLSVMQQKFVKEAPLLLVRNHGRVTTAGSTFNKGFAHQFCMEDGGEVRYVKILEMFPDKPHKDWMLVSGESTMVWFQYGDKSQFCGSGYDVERHYYGKLMIRTFIIEEDFEPRLDKNADNFFLRAKQFRVANRQIFHGDWNVVDREPENYLEEFLAENKLERFGWIVKKSLAAACGTE